MTRENPKIRGGLVWLLFILAFIVAAYAAAMLSLRDAKDNMPQQIEQDSLERLKSAQDSLWYASNKDSLSTQKPDTLVAL